MYLAWIMPLGGIDDETTPSPKVANGRSGMLPVWGVYFISREHLQGKTVRCKPFGKLLGWCHCSRQSLVFPSFLLCGPINSARAQTCKMLLGFAMS
jgi:hypothetical protein